MNITGQPSQPAQPALEGTTFVLTNTNPPRPNQNYYTHAHPSPVVYWGNFERFARLGARRGELDIAPILHPPRGPCQPQEGPYQPQVGAGEGPGNRTLKNRPEGIPGGPNPFWVGGV